MVFEPYHGFRCFLLDLPVLEITEGLKTSGLKALLEDPSRQKLMHDSCQAVLVLHYGLGIAICNVYDTMVHPCL